MIELSVVTGTYNRLPHLKQMVESVRQSIGVGIPYEIVLVDGGSEDGTIDWCKQQSDVVLIEQGELLGGIKAFNAGLYAASGRYCIVGNDDITYIDETLLNALSFMHDNPDVGVGCFYQDRHSGDFTLDRMPAVMNNEQVMHVYGQVCIVPRWLGDEVGWWGNFPDMRTYGGDNNLSGFVMEKGYKVTGVKCACIHDMQVDDNLRKINNELQVRRKRTRGGHPDSNAWGHHWTHRDGTCGPIIKTDGPHKPNPLERETRFLYLPIYEAGHDVQRRGKRGLRDALANYGLVYEYDYLYIERERGADYMRNYLMDIMDSWKPDVLLTQIHSPGMFDAESVGTIRRDFPDVTWVNWNGDYHPEDLLSQGNIDMVRQFDLQCVVTTRVRDAYTAAGVSWMYWQIGYEESDAQPVDNTPRYDVIFLGTGYSGPRMELAKVLRSLGCNVGIYGSWGKGIKPNGSNLYDFDSGAKLYRAAKLSIGDNQWGDTATGFVSNRLFQAMSAGGALYMQQHVPELDNLLGLEGGKHYVVWSDLGDLRRRIAYWLKSEHEGERQRIAAAGRDFVLEHHSFDARVAELMEIIG